MSASKDVRVSRCVPMRLERQEPRARKRDRRQRTVPAPIPAMVEARRVQLVRRLGRVRRIEAVRRVESERREEVAEREGPERQGDARRELVRERVEALEVYDAAQ